MSETAQDIVESRRGAVLTLTFNRPASRNAFTFAMYQRLAEICARVDADRSVRALVLTGAGDDAFAAGTDIAEFRAIHTPEDALAYEAGIDCVLSALEACRVPTIAAIAGACTGGGAAIAACCDLRVGAANARIGFPIARTLGNCLSMASLARLSRLIGPGRIKELIFTARLLSAEEGREIGFLGEVLPSPDAMRERAAALAESVAAHAPLTLAATKEGLARLTRGVGLDEGDDLVVRCYTSRDFREGMKAFLEKRPPRFVGA